MPLPAQEHVRQPWEIHGIAHDFRLEDVWEIPVRGSVDDFPRLVDALGRGDPARQGPRTMRLLFAIRWKLGAIFGWDRVDPDDPPPSLQDRVSPELWATVADQPPVMGPFTPLYLTKDEFAAEIANRTMHGVLHLGWVPAEDGQHRGQLAVLVKPNGRFGTAYMAAIKPFRHLLVYPQLLRQIEQRWQRATVRS